MSRISAVLAIALLTISSVAWARTLIDVADVNNVRLGREVTLEGHVVQHLREDYYKFQDSTGSVRIELERGVTRGRIFGRSFGPETKVRIVGDVDRGFFGRYISVERFTILD
jgi:uncharacterized protein (TIGR00156 family)